ncbi:MAG: tRNA lysidine(34) synthetase TilS [Parvularculaceae bacterium]|nr:tRNA lysidine(34) synthetase TilS [Parvularculaceae bacterium]
MGGPAPLKAPLLDAAGFYEALMRLDPPRRLLLAVSGGADSMAMMRLCAPLRDRFEFAVASVDHRLRAGARAEAELAANEARRLGFDHAILERTGARPQSGVQAAARAARYRLLINHACASGAGAIVTAHNADDQAETALMRAARRSGVRGLAAMAPASFVAADAGAAIRLLRPLLQVRRRDLRNFLTRAGAPFADDPSNEDAAYERVRVRREIAQREAGGEFPVERLCENARAAREAAFSIETAENNRFASLNGRFDEHGAAHLGADLGERDAALIARVVQAVAGGDYPLSGAQALKALKTALSGCRATLGGAMVKRRGDEISIFREPAAVLGRAGAAPPAMLEIAPGQSALWDARFIVSNRSHARLRVAPAGAGAAAGLFPDEDRDLAAGAPVLWRGGELIGPAWEFGHSTPLADERFFRRVNRFAEIT